MSLTLVLANSSNIDCYGYDKQNQVLAVGFKDKAGQSTGLYVFLGVPEEVSTAMDQAESVGSFFAKNVRGKFPFTKIECVPYAYPNPKESQVNAQATETTEAAKEV